MTLLSMLSRILGFKLGSKPFRGKIHRSRFRCHRPYLEVLEYRTLLTRVAVGDFRGDGHRDVVVTNPNTSTVGVLLGKGDGSLQDAQSYFSGNEPTSVAVGDFNRDGHLDLVVTNGVGNTVSVLLGNGDGTFQPPVSYRVGSNPDSVAVGDFRRDGLLDLVVANQADNTVSVLLGNGDGTFRPPVSYRVGSNPASVVVEDFNGDGIPDLAVANEGTATNDYTDGSVSVLLGKGDGTFQAARSFPAGVLPLSVTVGDFNRDGHLDLVVANGGSGMVSVLLGSGDGIFGPPVSYFAGNYPDSVAAGDFRRDGRLDLVVANLSDNTVTVLRGNGDGKFPQPVVSYRVGSHPNAVAVGDLRGDGRLDVVTANLSDNTVSVLRSNGDGTFQPAVSYSAGTSPNSVAAGDFNGDGHLDLAVSFVFSKEVNVLLLDGNGMLQRPPVSYTFGFFPNSVAVEDFNGDGHLDLAVVGSDDLGRGMVSILLGNGDGTFRPPVSYPVGLFAQSVAVGDFNGDRHLDLAVTGYDEHGRSMVSILLGNGDGTFQAAKDKTVGISLPSVAVGDFRGDRHLDLAVADYYSKNVSILLGNGDGTFQPPVSYDVGAFPQSVVVGDLRGDGHLDLVVANGGSNSVSVLLGNGDGTFQDDPSRRLVIGSNPTSVALGDFNGDGTLDLAVINAFSNSVNVYLGNGDGTFQQHPFSYPIHGFPQSVVVGDFDGDGSPDLAVVNIAGGVTLVLNPTRPDSRIVPVITLPVAQLPAPSTFPPISPVLPVPGSDRFASPLIVPMTVSQAMSSSAVQVRIPSGSSAPEFSVEVRGSGSSDPGSELLRLELPSPALADISVQELLSLSTMDFAMGLETLLTGNQEQVAELLSPKESSLVPLPTLLPGRKIDLSTERRADSSDPSTRNLFLVGFDPPAPDESQTAGSAIQPIAPVKWRNELPQGFRENDSTPSSPKLLDLLVPKPRAEDDGLPTSSTDRDERLPAGKTQSSSGSRNRTGAILHNRGGTKTATFPVLLVGILFTATVLRNVWLSPISACQRLRNPHT